MSCLSLSIYGFWLPLWYLQTFMSNISIVLFLFYYIKYSLIKIILLNRVSIFCWFVAYFRSVKKSWSHYPNVCLTFFLWGGVRIAYIIYVQVLGHWCCNSLLYQRSTFSCNPLVKCNTVMKKIPIHKTLCTINTGITAYHKLAYLLVSSCSPPSSSSIFTFISLCLFIYVRIIYWCTITPLVYLKE